MSKWGKNESGWKCKQKIELIEKVETLNIY